MLTSLRTELEQLVSRAGDAGPLVCYSLASPVPGMVTPFLPTTLEQAPEEPPLGLLIGLSNRSLYVSLRLADATIRSHVVSRDLMPG